MHIALQATNRPAMVTDYGNGGCAIRQGTQRITLTAADIPYLIDAIRKITGYRDRRPIARHIATNNETITSL